MAFLNGQCATDRLTELPTHYISLFEYMMVGAVRYLSSEDNIMTILLLSHSRESECALSANKLNKQMNE